MKRERGSLGAPLAVAALARCRRPAEARLIDLYAGRDGGRHRRVGDDAEHARLLRHHARRPGVGFDLGFKLLVFDFSANFFQVVRRLRGARGR